MTNIIKSNISLDKNSDNINSEVLGEIQETSENISNIVYISEIQKKIWELERLKRSLKENKENFKIFEEKFLDFSDYYYKNKNNFLEKEKKQFRYLSNFRSSFKKVLEEVEKIKTVIEKNENTKREILIIGQRHITGDGKSDYYVFSSQFAIDTFLEYFLDDNLVIGDEKYGTNSKNNTRHITILIDLITFFIEKGYLKPYLNNNFNSNPYILSLGDDNIDNLKNFLNYPIPISSEDDIEKIEKFFNSQEMITFYGKQFFKKDNEKYFKNLCILKYFIKKLGYKDYGYLIEANYNDYKFSNLGRKKIVDVEEDEGVKFDIKKFFNFSGDNFNEDIVNDLEKIFQEKGMENFLKDDLEFFLKKYFFEENILLSEYNELLDLDYKIFKFGKEKNDEEKNNIYKKEKFDYFFGEIIKNIKINKNNFRIKITTLLKDLEDSKEKLKKEFGNIGFIDFLDYIRFKILNYIIFTHRESITIENIEKFFPKDQKQIPIIFGCSHNKNWKKIVEKHNQENPENQYSLKIINFGFEEFNFK